MLAFGALPAEARYGTFVQGMRGRGAGRSTRGQRYPDAFRNARKARDRLDRHLAHDAGSVDLDGLFGDSEIGGDLLVQVAGYDELEHAALALGQRFEPLLKCRELALERARRSTARKGAVHGVEQIVLFYGFREEIDRARTHSADG